MRPFDRHHVLHELKHYLPAQAPLKDFVHHNSLHAFQQDSFFLGLKKANELLGYKTTLPLSDYRARYGRGEIHEAAVAYALKSVPEPERTKWEQKMHFATFEDEHRERVGQLRRPDMILAPETVQRFGQQFVGPERRPRVGIRALRQ